MAYTTIDDPSAHFQTATYTGNITDDRAITNDGNSDLQPDLIWFKNRATTNSHNVLDSTRGITARLRPDDTSAEASTATRLKSFDSDGMTISTDPSVNGDGNGMVAWQWKANGGTTTSGGGTDSVSTSAHQANTTAGFSIVTYTGNDTAGATVAHGLGVVPSTIIVKDREQVKNWNIYHKSIDGTPENFTIRLNNTDAKLDTPANGWNDTAPTSSVFSIGDGSQVNSNGITYVAYCFTEIQGYSKFGSYTGNGNADGPFVYTGFKPAWLLAKRSNNTGDWILLDNARTTSNPTYHTLKPNSSAAEITSEYWIVDFLSNGFKVRLTDGEMNGDGDTFVYMAFAEQPFVTSGGVPCTAR